MMKLKNILNELEIRKGHFGKEKSFDLLDDFLFEDKMVSKEVANKVSDYVSTISADKKESETLLPKDLQRLLIGAGKKVYSKGTIQVIKKDTDKESVVYAMYDFSKPAYNGLFFIGRLLTTLLRPELPLSPQKQFRLNRVEKISLSQLGVEHLGQGFGSILYDSAIASTDALYSDVMLYGGSFKVWVNHMRNRSKFFGIYSGERKVLLPIYDEEGMEKAKLSKLEMTSGFVAISKSVPSKLLKLQEFLDGINPHDVQEIQVSSKLKGSDLLDAITYKIDSSSDSIDFLDQSDSSYKVFFVTRKVFSGKQDTSFVAGYITSKEATIFVKETGGGLDWFMV